MAGAQPCLRLGAPGIRLRRESVSIVICSFNRPLAKAGRSCLAQEGLPSDTIGIFVIDDSADGNAVPHVRALTEATPVPSSRARAPNI